MAFKKGVSGNPGGRPGGPRGEKEISDALRIVGKRTDIRSKKTGFMKLAEEIFKAAIDEHEGWAANLIFERIEGKVPQAVAHTHEQRDSLNAFTEAELTEMLRQRMGNTPPPTAQPQTTPSGETLN